MAADIPTQEPAALHAGDTWKWTIGLADYPAGTWTLKYRFKSPSSGFEITASADGLDHAVVVAATTTAGIKADSYDYVAWVESGAEKYTVRTGRMDVLPDFRGNNAAAALDNRSHAGKMLAAIESWLENHDPAVAEYEILGRRMKYIPIAELVKLRNRYQLEVQAEDAAAAIARGEGLGRKIQFRV